jgi:predicted RNA-binding protein YlqC (UPF0109 family)
LNEEVEEEEEEKVEGKGGAFISSLRCLAFDVGCSLRGLNRKGAKVAKGREAGLMDFFG